MRRLTDLNIKERENLIEQMGIESDSHLGRVFNLGTGIVYRLRDSLDISVSPNAMEKEPTFNIHCFDRINHVSAYWLGFLFSDGCISETTGDRKILSFSLVDRDSVEKFSKFIEYKKPIRVGFTPDKRKNTYGIAVANEYIFRKLESYGLVKNKTNILQRPHIDDKFIFSFLCGYFDGDGSISLNTRVNSWKVSFGFASYNFYLWFNSILDLYDISYSVENNRKTPLGNNFYITCLNGLSGKYFLKLCYENLPKELPLNRKIDKYWQLCKKELSPPRYKNGKKKFF